MIKVGVFNKLKISKEVSFGLFLQDKDGEEVLLPNKYCPVDYEIGDELDVFIYIDKTDQKVATNIKPQIKLHEFAKLRVASVTSAGAFMDWGLDKHLFVPGNEQRIPMEIGEWHIIYMLQDEETEKLFGSKRVERYLSNDELTVKEGDAVDLLVYQNAGFGLSVIINNKHKGMIYNNQTFKKLRTGDRIKGWVAKIRDDNKIDISLQPIGYKNFIDPTTDAVVAKLKESNGFLPLNDKSDPELIYNTFEISKKAFKKAIGSLFKEKVITIEKNGIKLV